MPDPRVFVDTSAWYAYFDAGDSGHRAAVAFLRGNVLPLVTSNWVLAETLTLLRRRSGHGAAVKAGEVLRRGDLGLVERVLPEDEEEAWRIFAARADYSFSLVHCTSFALMARLGIQRAFAFDRHFHQYGRILVLPAQV